MVYCAAVNCKSKGGTTPGVTFHKFPKDNKRREIWERNVRRANWKPTTNTVLCSTHFMEEDFEPAADYRQKRDLKKTAVPTIFDYPEHLQPKKPKLGEPPHQRSLASVLQEEQNDESKTEEGFLDKNKLAVEHDHDYCLPSQAALKLKLDRAQEEIVMLEEKLAAAQKKTSFQKRQNLNLKSTIEGLKSSGMLEPGAIENLKNMLTPTLQELFNRVQNTTTFSSHSYSSELRVFAATLNFYSPKAYEFVRRTFNKALPHERTIRKWFSNISGSPGFCNPALDLLKEKTSEGEKLDKPVFVSLMLDEMSLKRQIDYDATTSSYSGYVNIGEGVSQEGQKPATDALVLMVVGINWHFKIPIAYFFIAGLSGSERANLTRMALQKIHETGAKAVCFISDGPAVHLTMMKELGANLEPENLKPSFSHPSDPENHVHVLLDIAHMIKLTRNSLASEKILLSPSGLVRWEFIVKLFKLQETEGLRAGNKLKRQHIEWERHKMNVSVAAQTLSASVADALDFLREDLQSPEFQGSEATSEFIRFFDSLFDIFNSKNIFGKNFKAPLQLKNEHQWLSIFAEGEIYIKSLQRSDGTPILWTGIRTGFLGFLCGIRTFQNLFDDLVRNGPLDYIITYKFSQDHLELFFGSIRMGLGCNNNPSCQQFTAIFKKLLTQLEIRSAKGNCQSQDSTTLLTISSAKSVSTASAVSEELNFADMNFEEDLQDLELEVFLQQISSFKENIIVYMAGYVVRMVLKKIRCSTCATALTCSRSEAEANPAFALLNRKRWGHLTDSSHDVIAICIETEKIFSLLEKQGKLTSLKSISTKITTSVLKNLFQKTN